jgi:cell division protein ZapA
MKEIEILIGDSQYKISCKTGEEERILYLADLVNKRLSKLSKKSGDLDEKTLLVILSLMIEDELERKLDGAILQNEIEEEDSKFNDQDIYDTVSENMENVASYIEKLSEKIKNY